MRSPAKNIKVAGLIVLTSVLAILLISAERNDGFGVFGSTPMPLQIPAGWPKPKGDIFANNPPTLEIFVLGKKLFYDGNLSSDKVTSCGSCHQQFAAFSTFDHDLSHGVTNKLTTRNAPALQNLAWMTNYHWDGGVANLEMQPLNPITAPNEMGATLEQVIKNIKEDESYKPFFKNAFGDAGVSSARILKALAQFTGQLVSATSKYDNVKAGRDTFSVFEKAGYELYKENCNTCHKEPLFTDNDFHNNALTLNRFSDAGRQGITGLTSDSLKFKTPSLRNVQLTHPYMHDGSYFSVDAVIKHYQNLDRDRTDIDPVLKKRIVMSPLQRNQLIYFLYTLTDTAFTKNKLFAPENPLTYKD